MKLVNLGFGNVVRADRVVAVVQAQGAPMKRLKEEASAATKLVDATQGRRTRSIIVCDSDHVILSAVQVETIAARLAAPEGAPEPEETAILTTESGASLARAHGRPRRGG
jgi:extracellular matrix regulatory protein A